MRIEKLVLSSYRQFEDTEITFPGDCGSDLHIFIGSNGTGKTNLLNAVNWCLYGDEPHLSRDSSHLPLPNLRKIERSQQGQSLPVRVEVWTRTDDGRRLVFEREVDYTVRSDSNPPLRQGSRFEVRSTDAKGNTEVLTDPDSSVERFVPERIREFFFFDGERLDSYFRRATGQRIRHAVADISQIDLLERTQSKLREFAKDVERDAGKQSPEIESARSDLEQEQNRLAQVSSQIEACIEQIEVSKEQIRLLEESLRGVPDIEALEREREDLLAEKSAKEASRSEKISQKRDLLFDHGKIAMLWPCLRDAMELIETKREENEIPPSVDKGLLRNILEEGICTICGATLDSGSRLHVQALFREIDLSSDLAYRLSRMEISLRQYQEKALRFENEMSSIAQDIRILEGDLTRVEGRLQDINNEIAGYHVEQIKEWHRERRNWEDTLETNQRKMGALEPEKARLEESVRQLRKRLDKELDKVKKVEQLKRQIDLCSRGLQVLGCTKDTMMSETRGRIEEETSRLFFELIWKEETFRDLLIDEDYNMSLIHSMGYECLGSVSAAERELLALSFTLALHKVSGFNSPVLIDTPVARVSDLHRESLARVFSRISGSKQIILLFTPAEYSQEIYERLESRACTRRMLQLSEDEKVTTVEVR